MDQNWISLAELEKPFLQKNLNALQNIQPALVPLIVSHQERPDIFLRQEDSGWFSCKYQTGGRDIQVHGRLPVDVEIERCFDLVRKSFQNRLWLAVVFAAGQGTIIPSVVSYLETYHRGEAKGLVLMEQDPGLLCAGFSVYDLETFIRSGRVLFALGPDLPGSMKQLCEEHKFSTLAEEQTGYFPGSAIEDTKRKIEYQNALQQYVLFYRESRAAYLQLLKKAEFYWSQSQPSIKKVWTQVNDERAGGRLVIGLAEGFMDAGLDSSVLRFADKLFSRFYRCAHHFFSYQPDLILSLNHSSNYTVSFAQGVPIPRVVWYVDHPSNTVDIPYHPHDFAVTVSTQFFPEIQRRGGKVLGVLSAACSGKMEEPQSNCEWRHDVSYVGTVVDCSPILDQVSEECRDTVYLIVENQIQNPYLLMETILEMQNLEPSWKNEIIDVLPRFFSKAAYMSEDRLLTYFLYTLANTLRRIRYIESLADYKQLGIYGPVDWLRLLSSPLQHCYKGSIGSVKDLSQLYQTSKVNLSINSLQGNSFINQRMFEVPSSGGFLLAEYVPGLENYFEKGREMTWFSGIDEMKEQIHLALKSDEERMVVTLRMQKKLLAEHTFRIRAEALLEMIHQTGLSG